MGTSRVNSKAWRRPLCHDGGMTIQPENYGITIMDIHKPENLRSCAIQRVSGDMMTTNSASYDANSGNASEHDPTILAYGHFVVAYRFFNDRLFTGSLPNCLITMQRKKGARGFFHGNRFGSRDQAEIIDEIALNPAMFAARDDRAILSTLVHEMVHLWQHRFGTPSTVGYHNREWAAKMGELGLIASHTGKPGGRHTGRRVTHFVEPGGLFDSACEELLRSGVFVAYVQRGGDATEAMRAKKAASKSRYSCAGCGLNAWAKPGVRLACGDCRRPLLPLPSGV